MIITNFMTEEGLNLLHASAAARRQKPSGSSTGSNGTAGLGKSGGSDSGFGAGAPAAGDGGRAGGSTAAVQESGGAAVAAAKGPADGSNGSSDGTSGIHPGSMPPPPTDLQKSGLLSHFKWGCPDNCEEVGWD